MLEQYFELKEDFFLSTSFPVHSLITVQCQLLIALLPKPYINKIKGKAIPVTGSGGP
jgi:hypothetical protein